jgi:hypothetical protein
MPGKSNLADKRTKRYADAVGNWDLTVRVETIDGQALEVIGMLHALRPDDADLGKVPTQSVERRRTLAGEQFARQTISPLASTA